MLASCLAKPGRQSAASQAQCKLNDAFRALLKIV